jgi:hypothetical protein
VIPQFDGVPTVTDPTKIRAPGFFYEIRSQRLEGCALISEVTLRAVAGAPTDNTALSWLWDVAAPLMLDLPGVGQIEFEEWVGYPTVFADFELEEKRN